MQILKYSIFSDFKFSLNGSSIQAKKSVAIAATMNLLVIIPFVNALINPSTQIDFIYKGAMAVFIFEMLTLVLTFFVFAFVKNAPAWVAVLMVLVFIAVGFGWVLAINVSNTVLYIFIASLVRQLYLGKKSKDALNRIGALKLLIFLLITISVILLSSLIALLVPFSEELISLNPNPASGGVFVDNPQVLLVWGIIYFLLSTLVDIVQANEQDKISPALNGQL